MYEEIRYFAEYYLEYGNPRDYQLFAGGLITTLMNTLGGELYHCLVRAIHRFIRRVRIGVYLEDIDSMSAPRKVWRELARRFISNEWCISFYVEYERIGYILRDMAIAHSIVDEKLDARKLVDNIITALARIKMYAKNEPYEKALKQVEKYRELLVKEINICLPPGEHLST